MRKTEKEREGERERQRQRKKERQRKRKREYFKNEVDGDKKGLISNHDI